MKYESQVDLSLKKVTFLGFVGVALGLKNWIRITIGVEAQMLEDALDRLNGFCKRYMKKTEASLQALKLSDDGEI